MKNYFLSLLFLLGFTLTASAQITTGSIGGLVTDNNGGPLIGATITATHTPSGTFYGVTSLENGRYTIPNMRVGGPYTLEVRYLGYNTETMTDVSVSLGQKLTLDFPMQEEGVTASEIVITGTLDPILNGERTGAATSISRDVIDRLPSISRSASDYTRLNPMAAEGGSFGGRNDQFNNYSLDGTIFNNPFGLDAATPGGQTEAQPVSLDAIEQINVSIAPYDVTQSGFTGASINAVTKSGTNTISGSVFGYFRNASLTGGKVEDTDLFKGDLKQLQAGFALGGPIVKNKVFFFANLEIEQRSDLGSFWVPNRGTGASNESRVDASDMEMVSNLLRTNFGYETGEIENFTHDSDNVKALFKLDFNLSEKHKLSWTYNYLDAFKDKPAHPSAIGRRGPDETTLQFQNSGYRINNTINSTILELKSIFGSKYSNKLQVGYTAFRDTRDPFSEKFPVLNIGKDGQRYIIAGHEPFSIHNRLNQDVIQINNNFNIYSGDHTFTIGAAFERFNFDNSFNLTGYGFRVFFPDVDINDFEALVTSPEFADEVAAAQAAPDPEQDEGWALAETNLGQFSFYFQDEFAVNDQLTITAGIRADLPMFFNTSELIQENIDRKGGHIDDGGVYAPGVTYYDEGGNPVNFDHTDLPSGNILINPRLGFNYDVKGDRSVQLRGGTGLFSGRFPFVWIGNQVANPDFFFYNMTDPDFKFPQVWRTNIGYDQKIGSDWVATVDLLYTKDIKAAMVRNYGLKLPTGTLGGPDGRAIYLDTDRAEGPFGGSTNAYVFTNTDDGYSFNASFQLERSWNNNFIKLGYNYLISEDAASIEAEISSDAYDRNPANITHTNAAELAPSIYGNRHRIIGAASRRFEFGGGKHDFTLSLFTEYVEGTRYSYTYSGDINGDASALNDLIFIPTDAQVDQMTFSGDANAQAAQRAALKSYIANDSYLSGRTGGYAEKYGAIAPWYNHWDLRWAYGFNLAGGQRIELTHDILNVGNLINSSWGNREVATYTGLAQPIGVSVAGGEPTYTFDTSQESALFNDFSLLSRWQMQFGLRFRF